MRVLSDGVEYLVSFDRSVATFDARLVSSGVAVTDPEILSRLYQGQVVFDFASRMIGGSSPLLRENITTAEETIDAFLAVEAWQLVYDGLISGADFLMSPNKAETIANFIVDTSIEQITNIVYFSFLNMTLQSAEDALVSSEQLFEPAERAEAGFGVVENNQLLALAQPIMNSLAHLQQNLELVYVYDNLEQQPWWQSFWDIAKAALENAVDALNITAETVGAEAVTNLTNMKQFAQDVSDFATFVGQAVDSASLGTLIGEFIAEALGEVESAELTTASDAALANYLADFREKFPSGIDDAPVDTPPSTPPPEILPGPSDTIPLPDNDPEPTDRPPVNGPLPWSVPQGGENYALSARGVDVELRPGDTIPLADLFPSSYWTDSDGIYDLLYLATRDISAGGGYLEYRGNRVDEGPNSFVYERPIFEIDEWVFVAGQDAATDVIGFNVIQGDGDFSPSVTATVTTLERQLPDLVIADVDFDDQRISFGDKLPRVFETGDRLSIEFDVENIGPGDAGSSMATLWYFDGDEFIQVDSEGVSSIGSGRSDSNERLSFTISNSLDRGVYSAFIVPDTENDVVEQGRDADGVFAFLFEVDELEPALPDLVARNVTVSDTSPVVGDAISVSYEIANIGDGVSSNTTTGIYLSTNSVISTNDIRLGTDPTGAAYDPRDVDRGSVTVTLPTDLAPGAYFIGVVADYDNSQEEVQERNNESSDSVNDGIGVAITIAAPAQDGAGMGTGSPETLKGTSDVDIIFGLGGADRLLGLGGNDQLFGGNGDDILLGGAGADLLNGGNGIDRSQYTDAAAGVLADLQDPSVNNGFAAGDTYVSIENLYGSRFDDNLRGNPANNILWGDNGNDRLYGRGGNDNLLGMNGNDILYGQGGNDTLKGGENNDVLLGGAGADRLDGGNGIDLAQYTDAPTGVIADLQFSNLNKGFAAGDTYVSIERLYGSRFDDNLRADTNSNVLWGHHGNDTLYGRGGNDTLYGGDGDDALIGGTGADVMHGQNGTDTVTYANSATSVGARLDGIVGWGGAAGDTIFSVENLTGSAHRDTLVGSNGANVIDAGAGGGTIYGLDGDDTLIAGTGADVMYGQTGIDTVTYASSATGVGARLDGIVGWGGAAGDTIFMVENLIGSAYRDTLVGSNVANVIDAGAGGGTIYALDGDDTLIGGTGADVMYGQNGIDTVSYASSASGIGARLDGIVGWGGAAGDTIFQVENLIGSAHRDTLVGSNVANVIDAGAGGGTIYGLGGDDTLIAGTGADVMYGQTGADKFVFSDGFGNDKIADFEVTNLLEIIDLSDVSSIVDFGDLRDNHINQIGADVLIDDLAGNTVTLEGVVLAELLDANSFVF